MATVYILHSKRADKFYIGSSKDFEARLNYHLSKEFAGSFTVRSTDWELFFKIDQLDIGQAKKIEMHIKRMKSREYIHNLKQYPEMAEKLKQKYR